jgi:hypothetical protein
MTARMAATMAMLGVTAEEDAPEGDDGGTDGHADPWTVLVQDKGNLGRRVDLQADANTSKDTNEHREEDMRRDMLEQLAPTMLLVWRSPVAGMRPLMMVRVRMRNLVRIIMAHAALHMRVVAMLERLQVLELLSSNGQPLAHRCCAFLRTTLRELEQLLGLALLNLGHEQAALAVLDELHFDPRDAINEGHPDLEDLQINLNELKLAIGLLLGGANTQAIA